MLSQNNSLPVINSVEDEKSLEKLIISAKNGDTDAFGRLYTELYKPLYRYVFSKSFNKDVAEDICQQVFLKFYEAIPRYESNKTPLAYLFTIAKHLLINLNQKKTFLPFDEELLLGYDDTNIDILDEVHTQKLAQSINEYLPHLSDDEQEVIRLYFYAELSYKEISNILHKEEASLRKIKERALKKLRILTQHLYEGN